jgi:hypothetical protein
MVFSCLSPQILCKFVSVEQESNDRSNVLVEDICFDSSNF